MAEEFGDRIIPFVEVLSLACSNIVSKVWGRSFAMDGTAVTSMQALDPAVRPVAEARCPPLPAQVQSLPGALPAQMVRPVAGKVTWLLDSDSASGISADAWSGNAKAFPRSNMTA